MERRRRSILIIFWLSLAAGALEVQALVRHSAKGKLLVHAERSFAHAEQEYLVDRFSGADFSSDSLAALDTYTVLLYFLIGGVCCCVSHAALCPVDVVKTRQQGRPELYKDEATGLPLGMLAVASRIVQSEGVLALFTGLEATAVGYFVQGACKYGLWYILKFCFGCEQLPHGSASRLGALVLAAFLATAVSSALLCPYERARIRLVEQPDFAHGTLSAMAALQKEQGFFGGLFGPGASALAPTLLKMCSYATTQLTIFQLLTDALLKESWANELPRLCITFPSSVVAAIAGTLLSQPGDALQTQASKRAKAGELVPSMMEQALALGWSGLCCGWRTRIVMFSSMVVVQLMVYDAMRVLFGLT
mmetsp:Transcript_23152/g.65324  ORF Transcript_23152/g.65324 Transcript_23152/m.65324 type:complete len:363 (-) Transcript_23152:282-1370(-)